MMILAIKGHSTRGSEVIALLEMLGGINTAYFKGEKTELAYYIEVNKSICCIDIESEYHTGFYKITLEEFEEKFPYKIGDEVETVYGDIIGIIARFVWDSKDDTIKYELVGDVCSLYFTNELQPYKEDTDTITLDDFKAIAKGWLISKLKNMSKDDALQAICNIHDELHKPQYPKTYEECCRIVNANPCIRLMYDLSDGQKYSYDVDNIKLHNNFRRLKICRDAYWKIAGEEMKLGKPWEPDFTIDIFYPSIIVEYDEVVRRESKRRNVILVFPTLEMRNSFYENFKNLIKQCRKLL